ncbi:DUF1868 domain-containing protein [Streptomyces sp. NPDC007164]|uniref:DUF1868 domain-containing protein n=1 Tax=Streptomyces sp. NPDC007164 TaxID=3156918 RepID=UPI0033E4387F
MPTSRSLSRRMFAKAGGAALAGAGIAAVPGRASAAAQPAPLRTPLCARQTTASAQPGGKWYPDGSPRRFPGLTFTTPVAAGAFKDALTQVRDKIRQAPLGALFVTLPHDTYHTTILEGPVDQPRSATTWPKDLPIDTPLDDVLAAFLDKLRRSSLTAPRTLTFTPREVNDITKPNKVFSIKLQPDAATATALASFRAALGSLLQIPAPTSYDFHVTVGYRLYTNTEAEVAQLQAWRTECLQLMPPTVTLSGCQFTVFDNMAGFPVVRDL